MKSHFAYIAEKLWELEFEEKFNKEIGKETKMNYYDIDTRSKKNYWGQYFSGHICIKGVIDYSNLRFNILTLPGCCGQAVVSDFENFDLLKGDVIKNYIIKLLELTNYSTAIYSYRKDSDSPKLLEGDEINSFLNPRSDNEVITRHLSLNPNSLKDLREQYLESYNEYIDLETAKQEKEEESIPT